MWHVNGTQVQHTADQKLDRIAYQIPGDEDLWFFPSATKGGRIGEISVGRDSQWKHLFCGTFDLDQRTATVDLKDLSVSVQMALHVYGPSAEWTMSGRSGDISVEMQFHPEEELRGNAVVKQPFGAFFAELIY